MAFETIRPTTTQRVRDFGAGPVDASAFKRFSAGLSAPVLGGFLLLGIAVSGCDDYPEWAQGCSLDYTSAVFETHDAKGVAFPS